MLKIKQRIGCTNCYYITKPHWGEKNETGKNQCENNMLKF